MGKRCRRWVEFLQWPHESLAIEGDLRRAILNSPRSVRESTVSRMFKRNDRINAMNLLLRNGSFLLIAAIASLTICFAGIGERRTVLLPSGDRIELEVLREKKFFPSKRILNIQLEKRISETDLIKVAEWLRDSDRKDYRRVELAFLLPGMEMDAGAWATAVFTPALEIRIIGTTKEEHEKLVQAPELKREALVLVGSWLEERVFLERRIDLIQSNRVYYVRDTFKDESVNISPALVKPSGSTITFSYEPSNKNGEYYIVNKNRELEFWDREGKYYTAPPLSNNSGERSGLKGSR